MLNFPFSFLIVVQVFYPLKFVNKGMNNDKRLKTKTERKKKGKEKKRKEKWK